MYGRLFQSLVAINGLGGQRAIVAFIRFRQVFKAAAVFIAHVGFKRFIKAHDKAPRAEIEGERSIIVEPQIRSEAIFQLFHGEPAAFGDLTDFFSRARLQRLKFQLLGDTV